MSDKHKKKLFVFLTTYQSPHLEASFHFINSKFQNYSKIYVIDLVRTIKYRHEFNWRGYAGLRLNISRKIRNGFNKFLYVSFKKYQLRMALNFTSPPPKMSHRSTLSQKELFTILKTYSATEWGAPGIRINKYTNLINVSINHSSAVVNWAIEEFKITELDDFLIFNGRLPIEHAIIKTLGKRNFKNIVFHECNNYQQKIYFRNNSPHNLSANASTILNHKKLLSEVDIKKYLMDKGISLIEKKSQKEYVTYFTSSNDEFLFTYDMPVNQSEIIRKLLAIDYKDLKLKIRVHPNTANKSNQTRNYWDRLKELYPNIIINYDEKISSYTLCQQSKFSISMGSSMAAESLLLNVKHLLIADQNMYHSFPGFISCTEDNFYSKVSELVSLSGADKLFLVELDEKLTALASLQFNKKEGERIKLAPFGVYPTKEII